MRLFVVLLPLFLLFGVELYVFEGISRLWTSGGLGKALFNTLYWLLPVISIGAIIQNGGDVGRDAPGREIGPVLLLAFFAKVIFAGLLFLDDVRRVLVFLVGGMLGTIDSFPEHSTIWITGSLVVCGLLFLIMIYGMMRNRYRFQFKRLGVNIENLPSGLTDLKIIQLSDIHAGSFRNIEPLNEVIDAINAEQPDLIFFTGDLVNSVATEMNGLVEIFGRLKAKYGVYSILGNHDYGDYVGWSSSEAKSENFQKLIEIHSLMGWKLLRNDHEVIEIKGEQLAVIGVENYSAKGRFHQYGDLDKAKEGLDSEITKLLLSHDPSHWDAVVLKQLDDIVLTLSGHTHGMQFGIDLPSGFKWSPIKYAYPQWAGLYENNGRYLYVNRGFGFLGYPGRVGVLPEITVITLK